MNESTFSPRPRPSTIENRQRPFHVQKLVGDDWVTMSRWNAQPEEDRLQRHVRALGGRVKLVKGEQRVREWADGEEVFP